MNPIHWNYLVIKRLSDNGISHQTIASMANDIIKKMNIPFFIVQPCDITYLINMAPKPYSCMTISSSYKEVKCFFEIVNTHYLSQLNSDLLYLD